MRADWLAEEPDTAEREASALKLLEINAVPAPKLVAVDPTGVEAGAPAVLMTRVPGRIEWAPADLDRYLRRLAEPLPVIHAIEVPPTVTVPRFRPYELGRELGPPPWSRHRQAWQRAVEVYEGPPPVVEHRFIHRDYHPGNVLWSRGRVTGVVDWATTSIGSPEADVAHCRANLVGHFSAEVADRFLKHWQCLSGRTDYHPYWDITVVVTAPGSYGSPDDKLDDWIARAVTEL